MTDNDIIKALECCTNNKCHTDGCPLIGATGCMGTLTGSALDLITRQKAEIERLQNTLDDVLDREPTLVERSEKYAKAEAVNEFAERLKAKYRCYDLITPFAAIIEVDNTKKEMVGDV